MKVILAGATGMVGEGVLFECLQNVAVTEILLVSRKPYAIKHAKVKELLLSDFIALDHHRQDIRGFDACFFCAGVSAVGKKEAVYRHITYDTTLSFAKVLVEENPKMVFTYVSGAGTDSSEKGHLMWARVKGKTENDLIKLPFAAVYAFRPGIMQPFQNQRNWKPIFKSLIKVLKFLIPSKVLTMHEVGLAMIHAVSRGYPSSVLDVAAIRQLSRSSH